MFLAAASGLLLTLYSALYKTVKNEIDNSTVLMLRGVIQVQKKYLVLSAHFDSWRRHQISGNNSTLHRYSKKSVFGYYSGTNTKPNEGL